MPHFTAGSTYRLEHDVRDHSERIDLLKSETPHGAFWLLVAPRRFGKTWALEALKRHFTESELLSFETAKVRSDFLKASKSRKPIVLIDEPGKCFSNGTGYDLTLAKTLLERCQKLRDESKKIVISMTPRELECLRAADDADGVINDKDITTLGPLTNTEVTKLTGRDAWSAACVGKLPSLWTRNPYLLEMVFAQGEKNAALQADGDGLIHSAGLMLMKEKYCEQVWGDGLSDTQRQLVRAVARQTPLAEIADTQWLQLLTDCGVLLKSGDEYELGDPMLVRHLPPPLRIHHVSDLHVGPKHAKTGVAGAGDTATDLSTAVGHDTVINEYLDHVQILTQKPNLLVVSGDIAEFGTPEQYKLVETWFQKIEQELAPHPHLVDADPRVLLVGGNHDVNRDLIPDDGTPDRRHSSFAEAFPKHPRPKLEEPADKRVLAHVKFAGARLEIVLLGSAELGQQFDDISSEFGKLLDQACKLGLTTADRSKALAAARTEARIDPGLVHHQELQRLRKLAAPKNGALRLAVLHHHVSPMPHFTDVGRFAGLLNAGQIKDACFASQVALILHGHMHSGWFAAETWPGSHDDWTLRIAAAPTLGSKELVEHHGFNEITIYREGDKCAPLVVKAKHGPLSDAWVHSLQGNDSERRARQNFAFLASSIAW